MTDNDRRLLSLDGMSFEVVAHRCGNRRLLIHKWQHLAIVECDVRHHRGVVEVRHEKRIPIWGKLWDRWYVLASSHQPLRIEQALSEMNGDQHVWLDLKGWSKHVRAVVEQHAPHRSLTVSSKSWWMLRGLGAPQHDTNSSTRIRVLQSVGNRCEWLLFRLGWRSRSIDGVVIHHRLLSTRRMSILRQHGMVFTWAVRDEDQLRGVARLGVTGVILDEPLLEYVRQQGRLRVVDQSQRTNDYCDDE
jgi:hypothetical protein